MEEGGGVCGPAGSLNRSSAGAEPAKQCTAGSIGADSSAEATGAPASVQDQNRSGTDITAEVGAEVRSGTCSLAAWP